MMSAVTISDRIACLQDYRKFLGSRLFFVDEKQLVTTMRWAVTVYEGDVLYLYHPVAEVNDNSRIIAVRERNVIDAFLSYFSSLTEGAGLLETEMAQQEVDRLIAQLRVME